MTMNIDMEWIPDEYGYGQWQETDDSIKIRIADHFGFQRNRVEIDSDCIYYHNGVAEECDFHVNGVHYNARFNYTDPEKTRVVVY